MINLRKKSQTSKERELPKALLKNDKDNISEGNLDKKNKRKNKKDKSKNVLKIVIIFIVILIICFGTWLGIITHRWKKIAKDMLLDENSVVKETNSNVNTSRIIGINNNRSNICSIQLFKLKY